MAPSIWSCHSEERSDEFSNLSLWVRKMRVIFEKIPLHPKNFRIMGAAKACKAKDAVGFNQIPLRHRRCLVPKAKKHRNELAHFCAFFAFRDKAPSVPQWDFIKSHCIFCLANSGCTHYPKVLGVQGAFSKKPPANISR